MTKRVQKTFEELESRTASELESMYPNSCGYVQHFAFNHHLLAEFKELACAPFRVPCISGFVAIKKVNFKLDFALISRRDCR